MVTINHGDLFTSNESPVFVSNRLMHAIEERNPIYLGVLFSLLIHCILFVLFYNMRPPKPFIKSVPTLVEIVPFAGLDRPVKTNNSLQKDMPKQIVSPPDQSKSDMSKQETALLSDKNSSADREQIKRGDGQGAGIPLPATKGERVSLEKQSANLTITAKTVSKATEPEVGIPSENIGESGSKTALKLKLDDKTLLSRFEMPRKTDSLKRNPLEAQPFSRPAGSGAQFVGTFGSPDYLPHLPDGDITLLNTKADKFAVFVRRVATQIFAQVKSTGFQVLRGSEIQNIKGFVTTHARMSSKGELIDITLEQSSGSIRFDEVLVDAIKVGLRDHNPPLDAMTSDGTIHFVFKSNAWARVESDPRSGGRLERKWLLLATGLD